MSHTILVTGAAGYIGSIATEILLQEGYNVIALDDLSTGYKEALFNLTPFHNTNCGNIDELKTIFSKNKVDVVLHFAGAALVPESVKNPFKYFNINFCQAQNLLDIMTLFSIKKFIFSSTCAIYGIPKPEEIPLRENVQAKPINPYGESKLLFEKALEWYKKSENLDYIALRYFNVAGASKNRGERHNPETHLIPLVIKAAKNKNYELKVYGKDYPTKDGTAIRDYIHVVDLVYAHILAIKALINNKKHENIYNIGYGHGYSVLEIINSVEEVFKIKIPYKICEKRPGDPPVLIADSGKIKEDLNWKPKFNDITEMITSASKFIE